MFSVLMSVYAKENPSHFDRAMTSIWDEQTIRPNEIVLVKDGLLTLELDSRIELWKVKLQKKIKIKSFDKNVGLGNALNIGLQECSYEFVARMDADDISLPHRFEAQLKVFEEYNVDVCSAWIDEFDENENTITSTRIIPEYHAAIAKYALYRSPVNHIPVMFKKSAVEKAGGYLDMLWFEDYYLWVRMILSGSIFYNVQEPLANIRVGDAQFVRRRGLRYLKAEIRFNKQMLSMGFIDQKQYILNLSIRIAVRMLPVLLLKKIYRYLRM